jgi:hypothetical protein
MSFFKSSLVEFDARYDALLASCNGLFADADPSELATLTVDDLDRIIKRREAIGTLGWEQARSEAKALRDRYMSLPLHDLPPEQRAACVLKWADNGVDIKAYKREVIDHCANSNGKYYVALVDLVRKGALELTAADVAILGAPFVEHVALRCRVKRTPAIRINRPVDSDDYGGSDNDSDDDGCTQKMMPMERLLVNMLVNFPEETGLYAKLADACDPALRCLPMRSRIVSGELIKEVAAIYDEASKTISPAVKCRRELGIIMDNELYRHYRLADMRQPTGELDVLASRFTIEFPYMCYAYVTRVEVDIGTGAPADVKLRIRGGGEHVMRSCRNYSKSSKHAPTKVRTLGATWENAEMPVACVEMCMGVDWQHVYDVRIYGRALVLVSF